MCLTGTRAWGLPCWILQPEREFSTLDFIVPHVSLAHGFYHSTCEFSTWMLFYQIVSLARWLSLTAKCCDARDANYFVC